MSLIIRPTPCIAPKITQTQDGPCHKPATKKTIKVATDDPNILAKKVLIEEHKYYPEIIKKVLYD